MDSHRWQKQKSWRTLNSHQIELRAADENIDPEMFEELLDLDAIQEEHGEVADEILRRHVASVKQLYQMFGHHHSEEDSKFCSFRLLW